MVLTRTIEDFAASGDLVCRSRFGVIEMLAGRLVAVHLRAWPKTISRVGVWWDERWYHRRAVGDRCLLYYNQPWGHSNYLALRYVVSSRAGTLASFRGALRVLDEVARVKRSDAILCEVATARISDRLLRRWGWEPLGDRSRRRNFIRRFYGQYPPCGMP